VLKTLPIELRSAPHIHICPCTSTSVRTNRTTRPRGSRPHLGPSFFGSTNTRGSKRSSNGKSRNGWVLRSFHLCLSRFSLQQAKYSAAHHLAEICSRLSLQPPMHLPCTCECTLQGTRHAPPCHPLQSTGCPPPPLRTHALANTPSLIRRHHARSLSIDCPLSRAALRAWPSS